ncbi:hypothetical protein PVAP13_7NG115917 [Panicum virgatum]|uniref:CBS domain-containing protein n=1 Tax=Panicum virgatum TaxID=38727 RepID=A0A8T0PWR5_PANVG|nr:hypothetical protein PVAP13_7NG115917 [Panicum virgatum]
MTMGGERTVKRLRLSRALRVPESTTVLEVCRRMAARRADAALLTDSNALLCGILTDKDIATRVVARELKIDETPVWKVMTRHPIFVLSDTLAVEALQKMVQGKFRHLPVVDNARSSPCSTSPSASTTPSPGWRGRPRKGRRPSPTWPMATKSSPSLKRSRSKCSGRACPQSPVQTQQLSWYPWVIWFLRRPRRWLKRKRAPL